MARSFAGNSKRSRPPRRRSPANTDRNCLDRVRQALQDSSVQVAENDLIREVAIFADRPTSTRKSRELRCHLEQFDAS